MTPNADQGVCGSAVVGFQGRHLVPEPSQQEMYTFPTQQPRFQEDRQITGPLHAGECAARSEKQGVCARADTLKPGNRLSFRNVKE